MILSFILTFYCSDRDTRSHSHRRTPYGALIEPTGPLAGYGFTTSSNASLNISATPQRIGSYVCSFDC